MLRALTVGLLLGVLTGAGVVHADATPSQVLLLYLPKNGARPNSAHTPL